MAKRYGDGLTDQARLFAHHWYTTHNGVKSAIAAGYKKSRAAQTASRLLRNPDVQAIITRLGKKDERTLEITRERALLELAKGLYRDPVGLEDENGFMVSRLRDIPPELRAIIDSFKVTQTLDEDGNPVSQKIEVKLMSKASAVDMAMKHLGAYAAEQSKVVVGVDWDSMHERSVIMDPVEEPLRQIQGQPEGSDEG